MQGKTAPPTRRLLRVSGLVAATLVPGCFALFSLDEYGPPAVETSDAAAADVATVPDATIIDARPTGRLVFVTRETFGGDLGGLDGGDDKCQAAAVDGGHTGTFRAWLSDKNAGTLDHLVLDGGPLRLANGALVASSAMDLAASGPQSAIVFDQRGLRTNAGGCEDGGHVAWTDTLPDGGSAGQLDCQRWRSSGGQQMGVAGIAGSVSGTWTAACLRTCVTPAALYCIQQ